ncbi:hypothetical protein AERO_16660, partial [Aeromicrobium fastidiosum]|uniref:hypothetical protein n=1 Tax=Aeromicrobium fastidiosum TaxID=52699 RepID=UPI0020235F3D
QRQSRGLGDVNKRQAVLAHRNGRDREAARLLGASAAIRGRADRSNRDVAVLVEALGRSLGADELERLRSEGAALDQQAAVALVVPGGARRPLR